MKYKSKKGKKRPCGEKDRTGCKSIIDGPANQKFCKECARKRRLEQSRAAFRKWSDRVQKRGPDICTGPVLQYSDATHCQYCGKKLSIYNHIGECFSDCKAKKAALGDKYLPAFSIGGGSNRSGLAMH